MDASTQRANLDIHSQLLGLPLGFHFSPSDEELVAYFLVKKLRGEEADFLPFVFNDARAMDFHPAALPDSSYFAIKEHEWYFFVPGKRSRGRPGNRRAGSGYWKASVSGDVMSEGEKVGKKRTLCNLISFHLEKESPDVGKLSLLNRYSGVRGKHQNHIS
ncbi:hypothetical protein H6P81_017327 [Aristolochia fimbriata]|uniref:NAC domain-containing protein n=1 Tax=Aristolochia fimbriata TaxID=158543 RepID=A0AAV7DY15_ARIFI|nr:hypothetical protein H6P81_017327 [Aristolochia fimbriata]